MRSKGNTDIKKQHKKANTNSISFQKLTRYHKNVIQRQYRYIKKQHMNTYTNSLPLKKDNTLSQKCDPKAIQKHKKTTHEHLHKLTSTKKKDNTLS